MPFRVDVDGPVRHVARFGLALRPAEQRADARDELVRAERLGDVVVGADFEPDDPLRTRRPAP